VAAYFDRLATVGDRLAYERAPCTTTTINIATTGSSHRAGEALAA